MKTKIFYYTVRTCGDGDKNVNIYEIKRNKPVSVGFVEVAWGYEPEASVQRYVTDNNLAQRFHCIEL